MDYIMATDWLYGGGPNSTPTSPSDSNSSTVTNAAAASGQQDDKGNTVQPAAANKQEMTSSKQPAMTTAKSVEMTEAAATEVKKEPIGDDDEERENGSGMLFIDCNGTDDDSIENNNNGKKTRMMMMENDNKENEDPHTSPNSHWVPMLVYLCLINKCTLKELQVLLTNLERRQWIVDHLRQCRIMTTHIGRPRGGCVTNDGIQVDVHCNDLTAQNANVIYAFRGYLSITVRQYYYARYQTKLRHPYLPCVVEYGGPVRVWKREGGQRVVTEERHASFYPLEMLAVYMEPPPKLYPQQPCHQMLPKQINPNPPPKYYF